MRSGNARDGTADDGAVVAVGAGAGAGAISGLALALVLVRTAAVRGQRQVWLIAASWTMAATLAWLGPFLVSMPWKPLSEWAADRGSSELSEALYNLAMLVEAYPPPPAFVAAGAAAGIIGGLLTGLNVQRWDPEVERRDVLTLAVGWGAAWAVAWLLPGQFFSSEDLKNLLGEIYQGPSIELLPVFMFVAGAVAGLLGGQTTLRQLASARQRNQAASESLVHIDHNTQIVRTVQTVRRARKDFGPRRPWLACVRRTWRRSSKTV